jgi:heavy metal translocating P-type ATPase
MQAKKPYTATLDGEYWKLGLAAVLAGQSMALSLGLNVAQLGPEHPFYYLLHGFLIVAALSVILLLGRPLFVNTYQALRHKQLSMESLFSLSLVGAWVSSCISTFYTHGPIYYEVVIIVCLIYTLGKMIRNYSKAKASQEAKRLQEELSFVYTLEGNQRMKGPVSEISVGKTISIIPGDVISVDGIVISGRGFVQESALSGEAGPVLKQVGDSILAGSYSLDASFSLRATALPPHRLIDSIISSVENAKWVPSLLEKKANAIVQHFVPLVVFIWLLSFMYWTLEKQWLEGLFNSMCVLLVACPCAFGLATPIAVYAGLYALAGLGLVSKKGYLIDILAKADTLVLDKTGTLTEEDLTIKAWTAIPQGQFSEASDYALSDSKTSLSSTTLSSEELASIVSLVQQQHPHPLAKAFIRAHRPSETHKVLETASIPGQGISAKVQCTESSRILNLLIGSLSLMPGSLEADTALKECESAQGSAKESRPLADLRILGARQKKTNEEAELYKKSKAGFRSYFLTNLRPKRQSLCNRSNTRKVYIALDGSIAACVELEEVLRKDTLASLKTLQAMGLRLEILSGDPSPALKTIGGIELLYGLKPEEKMQRIQSLKEAKATILYVGDGLNDVPAMNLCQASLALDHGSPLAQYSADGIILGGRLSTLVEAIELARKLYSRVISNYYIAIVYNVLGIGFAAAGLLNPVGAAAIMLLSSLTVAFRAYTASQVQSRQVKESVPQKRCAYPGTQAQKQ